MVSNPRPDWREDAACRGMDPNIFFPWDPSSRTVQMDQRKAAPAKQVCSRCPVTAECREAGADEYHGVWGGLSQVELREHRREAGVRPTHMRRRAS